MKDKKQKKIILPENKKVGKVKPIDPKYLQEQEQLFKESDRISPVSKKIDKDEIHLLGGTVTTWKELLEAHAKFKRIISDKIRSWQLTFPEEIYRQ